MKTLVTLLKTAALVLVVCVVVYPLTADAGRFRGAGCCAGVGTDQVPGECPVPGDLDGDGICDNFVDENNDGINDNAGTGNCGDVCTRLRSGAGSTGGQRSHGGRQ
ncbi:MAG: hypothetical protein V1793_01885 [Pseudomonadota bacterium]